MLLPVTQIFREVGGHGADFFLKVLHSRSSSFGPVSDDSPILRKPSIYFRAGGVIAGTVGKEETMGLKEIPALLLKKISNRLLFAPSPWKVRLFGNFPCGFSLSPSTAGFRLR